MYIIPLPRYRGLNVVVEFLKKKVSMSRRSKAEGTYDPALANVNRSRKLTRNIYNNYRLFLDVEKYLPDCKSKEDRAELIALIRNIRRCSKKSMYKNESKTTYITSLFCGSRFCRICNSREKSSLRLKYRSWFEKNKNLVLIEDLKSNMLTIENKGQIKQIQQSKIAAYKKWKVLKIEPCIKAVTQEQFETKYQHDTRFEYMETVEFDVLSYTLTIPHKETGFNGEIFYYKQFEAAYKAVRATPEFTALIYGGEYGFETTNNRNNGYHIHMHGIFLVKKTNNSRNKVYSMLLKNWNAYTVDYANTNKSFPLMRKYRIWAAFFKKQEIANIRPIRAMYRETGFLPELGQRMLEVWKYVNKLDPRGSTIVNVQSPFFLDKNRKKVYISSSHPEFIKTLLEVLKYHFEPQAFNKETKEYDIDLLVELLKAIRGVRLYSLFGCLHGEKFLKRSNKKPSEGESEIMTDFQLAMQAKEGEEGGENEFRASYMYLNPMLVQHTDTEIILSPYAKDKAEILKGVQGTTEALLHLAAQSRNAAKGTKF